MGNHYHLVIRTREANLSRLMRHINGVYTQTFNRRHQLTGHLFQGRFKAILVDSDSYLLEVCRYVDLNPVRANMTQNPNDYRWSSYRALTGLTAAPDWLDAQSVYDQVAPGKDKTHAAAAYSKFLTQGYGIPLWDTHLKQQIYLGGDAFIARMQQLATSNALPQSSTDGTTIAVIKRSLHKPNLSKIQSSAPQPDSDIERFARLQPVTKAERNQNIANAFYQGGHSQTAIAQAFRVSGSTVSRVIKALEDERRR